MNFDLMTPNRARPPKMASAAYIARVLRILHPPGSTIEIRGIGVDGRNKKTVAGYYRDFDRAARDVVALERRKPESIYTVMNQINPALYGRSPDRLMDYPEHTTGDKDIISRNWLLIDVDPERPSGISSTNEELASAIHLAAHVRDWFTERMGWPEPVEAMSGNG